MIYILTESLFDLLKTDIRRARKETMRLIRRLLQ